MKKSLILLIALVISINIYGHSDAQTITWSDVNPTVTVGDTFIMTIVGNSFTDGSSGGGLDISWTAGILNLQSINRTFPGDMKFGQDGTINNTAGTLSDLSVSSFDGTDNTSFDIAQLTFLALAPGSSTNTITIDSVDKWYDYDFNPISPDPATIGGSVTVNAIPIPSTVLLLGGGLAVLVGLRRRKSA
jgi:hypothetical protein